MNNKIRPHPENDECLCVSRRQTFDTQALLPTNRQQANVVNCVGVSLSLASNIGAIPPHLHFHNAPERTCLTR